MGKKLEWKSFSTGVLAAALVVGMAGTAFAASRLETKELYYNDIKILLNGKELRPTDANGSAVEPFVIDGTTYLPVRAVGEAMGLNVDWDGKTQTVVLGQSAEKGTPAAWLGEMTTFTGSASEDKVEKAGQYDGRFTANDGSTYDRRYYTDTASYLLKGQYSQFTGTYYLPEDRKNTGSHSRFLVYLDDELEYTSDTMAAGELPSDFKINVKGAYKMEIVFQYGYENEEWGRSGGDAYIADAALWQ